MLNEGLAKGCELASFLNCATSGLRTVNQAEIYFSMQWNVKLMDLYAYKHLYWYIKESRLDLLLKDCKLAIKSKHVSHLKIIRVLYSY